MGLAIISQYVDKRVVGDDGVEKTLYKELPMNIERPQIDASKSYIYIIGAVIVGTVLALVLTRFRSIRVWKTWFFLSVLLCLTIALKPFIGRFVTWLLPVMSLKLVLGFRGTDLFVLLIAGILAAFKIFRPSVYMSNITEIFIYGGLSAIFVPIIDLKSAFILLVVISAYDMVAVWWSKHMVKLATFQRDSKVFAGLTIPYSKVSVTKPAATMKIRAVKKGKKKVPAPKREIVETRTERTAILGGGDIGFPMFFAGVVLNSAPFPHFFVVMLIPLCVAAALFLLLTFGKQDRFYPAMPFLTAGCIVGYLLTMLF